VNYTELTKYCHEY